MTRPIRVLHCLCRVASGGVEQRLPLLIDKLPSQDFVHQVVCQDASGDLPARLRALGCEIHEIGAAPSLLSPNWYRKGIAVARAFRPDILHGGVIEGNALANIIGFALPAAKVISEETSHPLERKRHTELFLRALFMRSDVIIGVSPAVVDYLKERIRIPDRKLRMISNGVAAAPTSDRATTAHLRRDLGLEPAHRLIGTVGRIEESSKRQSDLVRALPAILEFESNARLLLIGDGNDRAVIEELADTLGVRHATLFAGYVGNPRPYYPIMELFALASVSESFGLVLVEAMLAGVPVVATKVGGIPFVLDQGRVGRLVPPRSPNRLAEEILSLLSDPAERVRLGDAGRKFAEANFTAAIYVRSIEQLYHSLLERDG